jgi:hypothetical protein
MAGMACAIVLDDQDAGRKCGGEFVADRVGNAHVNDEAMPQPQSQAIGLLVFYRFPPIIDP